MKFIPAVSEASIVKIPLFTERCPAGFRHRQQTILSLNHGSLAAAN